jgi:hypothetical protein
MLTPRRLHDEADRQELQCVQAGMRLDDDFDETDEIPSAYGADPFDVIAEIEAQQGYPLVHN